MDEYTYDNFGRLRYWYNTPIGGSKVTEAYTYDATGNLTKKGSKAYSYDESNQITTTGFTYDNNGNLTSDGVYSYAYDAENRLIQVNKVSDSSLVATVLLIIEIENPRVICRSQHHKLPNQKQIQE